MTSSLGSVSYRPATPQEPTDTPVTSLEIDVVEQSSASKAGDIILTILLSIVTGGIYAIALASGHGLQLRHFEGIDEGELTRWRARGRSIAQDSPISEALAAYFSRLSRVHGHNSAKQILAAQIEERLRQANPEMDDNTNERAQLRAVAFAIASGISDELAPRSPEPSIQEGVLALGAESARMLDAPADNAVVRAEGAAFTRIAQAFDSALSAREPSATGMGTALVGMTVVPLFGVLFGLSEDLEFAAGNIDQREVSNIERRLRELGESDRRIAIVTLTTLRQRDIANIRDARVRQAFDAMLAQWTVTPNDDERIVGQFLASIHAIHLTLASPRSNEIDESALGERLNTLTTELRVLPAQLQRRARQYLGQMLQGREPAQIEASPALTRLRVLAGISS